MNAGNVRKLLAGVVGLCGVLVFSAMSWFVFLLVRSSHLVTARDYARAVGQALAFYAASAFITGVTVAAYEALTSYQPFQTRLTSMSESVVHDSSGTVSDFHRA